MKIAFLGDIGFIGDYTYKTHGKEKLREISNLLFGYDYVIGNLETPLTYINKTNVCKSMHLKADKDNIELLKKLNISAVSLGNNHICDYGDKGLQETINVLEKNNINYFGVNDKKFRLDYEDNRLSFGGFCCYSANGSHYINGKGIGINALTNHNIERQLEADKKENFLSILSLHWGDEHTNYPSKSQVEMARKIADNNNVIIHGHHTHTIQGIENYRNSLIAYSLGNFCFDDCISPFVKNFTVIKNEENRHSYILEINISNNKIMSYKTIGIYDSDKEGIEIRNISKKLKHISNEITFYKTKAYEKKRVKQIAETRREKFSHRDIKWFISKMNYYSIGSRIGTIVNSRRSKKVYNKGY